MKNAKMFSLTLLALVTLGLSACGGGQPTTSQEPATSQDPTSQEPATSQEATSEDPTSEEEKDELAIALVDPDEPVVIRIDENYSAGSLWTITKGKSSPTNAEKKVLAVSSDTSIVSIAESSATSNPTFEAKAIGSCVVTVTLNKDQTKSIDIPVTVADAFFDYKLSVIHAQDDTTDEMPEDRSQPGGSVHMGSYVDSFIVVRNSATPLPFYLEGKISNYLLDGTDAWTKVGIMAMDLEETNSSVRFFIDVPIRDGGYYKNIGTVECSNNTGWGWQRSVDDTVARHRDLCFANPIPRNNFTLGMLREGLSYHIFVDGVYRFTWDALASLLRDAQGAERNVSCGFWNFNGVSYDITNYFYTQDEEFIANKKAEIASLNTIVEFDPKTVD
jgi:hypothetical protein